MAQIAFILLCHKDPDAVIKQAQSLTAVGDYIAIHFDASANPAHFAKIQDALGDDPNVTFAHKRIRCGWGEWSLVQATLYAVESALKAFPRATHFYMLSGDCQAIKSAKYTHDYLDEHDRDYIESFDYFKSDWIKTGWKEERLIYRHWFNERTQKGLFYGMFEAQKRLGLTREIPADIEVMIGSQWWCLRRRTIERVVAFTKARPDVMRFFRTTWIPDETFFQTIVRHVVPGKDIECRTLTFLMFTDYGMPVVFYNDHYEMLLNQDYLFARKISPEAGDLKARLGALYSNDDARFEISNEGRALFQFLSGKGRIGKRFGARFWERTGADIRDRVLYVVVCKKWHVAKRLVAQIHEVTGIPCLEYLFNEESCTLPDLGGIENGMEKRHRHNRALVHMLFDHFAQDGTLGEAQKNQLVICVDPSNIELLRDLNADGAEVRFLHIECDFDDAYLTGHARRIGLAGDKTPTATIARLLPTMRNEIAYETDEILDANFPNINRIRQKNPTNSNAIQINQFLGVADDKASDIAGAQHLFD